MHYLFIFGGHAMILRQLIFLSNDFIYEFEMA